MVKSYFKSAWRSIHKNRTTNFINIIGLSICMTATVLIFLWVQNEMNFDNYKDRENIYRINTTAESMNWVWETTPLLLADALKKEIPEIEKIARLNTNNQPVFNIKGNLYSQKGCAFVDEGWFRLFPHEFIQGNASSFNENPFSIILAATEAKKYFGDNNAIGQIIRVDSTNYVVKGVVADAPVNSSFQYKAFIPITAMLTNKAIRENDENWDNANYITFIKIRPDVKQATVARKITEVLNEKRNEKNAVPTSMVSLAAMHFETDIQNSIFTHGDQNTVYIFSFLGFLLLLIGCINYVNLTTARASGRAKEVGIRKITGARRLDLFFQFIAESAIVSLLSLFLTLILLQICLPAFNQLTGKVFLLPLTSPALWKVLIGTLSAALLLNSLYPAVLLSSFKPMSVFRGSSLLKVKDSFFRKGLVVVQFTVSVILIAGTITIYRQMQFIQTINPGYNRAQVISFSLPQRIERANRASLMQTMKQDFLAQGTIEGVGTSNQPVVDIGSMCSGCADWPGRDTSFNPKIVQLSADADFQKTMQLQMKEGRWLQLSNTGSHEFILNETAVKVFGLASPATGQLFIFRGDTGHIAGVVKDFNYTSIHNKIGPLVVFNNPMWRNHFMVRTAPQGATAAINSIQKIWKQYIPESPLEYTFLDDTFNRMYEQDQRSSYLIFVFAIIAVAVSALGLFSLAAFEAEQRTKEIGIRKVLGATVSGITTLLSKDFLKLVCIAILIASPVAWWAMNKWIQSFAYRIDLGLWIFLFAGAIAVVIALITVSFQAIKAAMANPAKSLRTE